MRDVGCLYMLTNDKHANVLAVSIWSLCKSGWKAGIHIACGDDKAERIAKFCADDARLDVTWHRWQHPTGKRGTAYYAKTMMNELSPFNRTVFLDADTLIVRDISALLPTAEHPVVLTSFAEWVSTGKKISKRIRPWEGVCPTEVAEQLSRPFPALNTGVLSFSRSEAAQAFFADWQATTAKRIAFICDEIGAQLCFTRHPVKVLDDRYNCSPVHSRHERPVIYHGHGFKFIKKEQGRKLWMPWYDRAVAENVASIKEWTPAGDRHLKSYLQSRQVDDAVSCR